MEENRRKQICARIKDARRVAGYTQPEMADLLGLTLRGYQNYEDERVPFGRLTEIAKLTNVEERWLLYGVSEKEPQDDLREGLSTLVDLVRSVDQRLARIEQAIPAPPRSRQQAEPSA